ncbi:MAG: hypothetical protein IJ157_07555 [Clostridia bacterium]|nr:hypothetical protein [Clostridia bacterium]
MKWDQFMQGKGSFRKNLTTAYVFILISVVFFLLFFFSTKELPVIACAFLCDAAAVVYLLRAVSAYGKEKRPPED